MTQDTETDSNDGVSKKLKIFVIILTAVTLIALVALFTKFASKQPLRPKNRSAIQKPLSSPVLLAEYKEVGERLMNAGLKEQAIDQFIKVWEMATTDTMERANAAQKVGQLYVDLNNCQEAMVWLFRAEVLDINQALPLQPLIDSCLSKIRSKISDQ
jgi:hypothetical protein